VATCVAAGVDLARWLVRSGLALDWPQYSRGAYASDQASAVRDGAGLFRRQLYQSVDLSGL